MKDPTQPFTLRLMAADKPAELPADFVPLRLALSSGRMMELTRADMVLGRHSSCDVRLPLPDVSRRHCRLFFQAGRWWIQDRDSLNGVFVNDERIETRALQAGDWVRVGGFAFVVQGAGDGVLRNIAAVMEHRRAS